MTTHELEVAVKEANAAWHGPDGNPLMNPNQPLDVATYRAVLEVAYQLALMNDSLNSVLRQSASSGMVVDVNVTNR